MNCAEPGHPDAAGIAACFNHLFGQCYRVQMIGGGAEPEYLPPTATTPGYVRYRSDYAHSALHEAAHWCVAGSRRRQQVDYGYWYQPPPRDESAQRAFARVEARVQALEAILTAAAGMVFQVSLDDVDNLCSFEADFTEAVSTERARWWLRGLPPRAEKLRCALAQLPRGVLSNG